MNYRERQLRQIIKKDYVPKIQHEQLAQEKQALEFKHGQILLDVDYQLQTHTKQENEQLKQDLVDWNERYQDLETNLNEQATQANQNLKKSQEQNQAEKQLYLTKINDLETALFNLAKQKLKGKKEASQLLTQLEQNWTQTKQTLEQELTNQKQAYGDLVLTNKKLTNLKQTLQEKIEDQKQRILALEADQQDLIHQLADQKEAYLNLRNQTSDILCPFANIPTRALADEHLISQAQEVTQKLTKQSLTFKELLKNREEESKRLKNAEVPKITSAQITEFIKSLEPEKLVDSLQEALDKQISQEREFFEFCQTKIAEDEQEIQLIKEALHD